MKLIEISEKYEIEESILRYIITREGIRTSGLFSPEVDKYEIPRILEIYEREYAGKDIARKAEDKAIREIEEKAAEEESAYQKAKEEMLLSTCPSVEGYRIIKQLGLVFGECAYKTGFFKSLSASLDNIGDILSSGDKELSGTARILNSARDYSMNKMIEAAIQRGANAVIGIDSESSIGGDIMHVTIYGTAVVIEKVENKE